MTAGTEGAKTGIGQAARRAEFVRHYLITHNASEAARRAGYERPARTGSRLLKNPVVREQLEKAEKERTTRLGITADRVLQELAAIAFDDPALAYDRNGNLLPIHEIPEASRRAITELESRSDDEGALIRKVKKTDKVKALELLGKSLGMWVDRTALEGAGGGPVVVEVVSYADKEHADGLNHA